MLTANEKAKILIVDDMPSNIKLLNETLQHEYRVFFATSGRDAVSMTASIHPDLVLLDVMMPEMGGYEVCRELKSDPQLKDIPVIFVTAVDLIEGETMGLEMGAVDYITKPFNPAIVKLRVKNHLELKRQRDLLAMLSTLDGLTGVSNRRGFDEFYQREWLRAIRGRHPMSILMIDIDHFKEFNDNYGHAAGDECLKKVARSIADCIERPADMAARYGGEEFVCVLPETEGSGAVRLAEKMRESVLAMGMSHSYSNSDDKVTVSIGVATILPTQDLPPEILLKAADEQLYEAKRGGRNRVKSIEIGLIE